MPQLNARQKDRTQTVVKSRPATRNLSSSMSSAFTHLGENIVQQAAPSPILALKVDLVTRYLGWRSSPPLSP